MGGISGFISASLIAVYMFSGWDTGILVNEETADAREKPGQSVVTSVIVLALIYAFLTFALQGAVHTKDLEANGDNALSYIAQVISGSALAKYMILAVALSALGSTLASLVSGVRVTFAMGSDGVLPRQFGKTDRRFRTPVLATVIIGIIASIGVWLYTFGSASVQDSFTTVVSVDGLLFALYYALTSIATSVYYRKLAVRSPWSLVQLAVFPLAAAGFLAYIVVRSVEVLGAGAAVISSRCTSCWESAWRSCSTCGSGEGRTTSACRGRPTSPTPNSNPQTLSRDKVPRPLVRADNYALLRCAENAVFRRFACTAVSADNSESAARGTSELKHEARQPSWSRMRRALASIRFSPADRPRLASRPARSRTTSTTWTRSPDASFSRFALYRCDQSRPSSPPSTVTPQPISKLPGSLAREPKLVPRMTAIGHPVMPMMSLRVERDHSRSATTW
jgi:Amino acid permease